MDINRTTGVVVAIDGTSGSNGALHYGVEQARARGCEVRLVHVGPLHEAPTSILPYIPHLTDDAAVAILTEAETKAVQFFDQVKVTTELRNGSRIRDLLDASKDAQLLVLGRETHTGMERLLFGATTAAVVARSIVSTFVIPAHWTTDPTPGRVVVGLRTADHTDELFATAFEAATSHAATIEVVHAWKMPDPYIDSIESHDHAEAWMAAGTDMIERALSPWRDRYPDVTVNVRVVHADPARALLAAAEGATLLLLLRRPTPKFLGAHLGATARRVIAAAPCPVDVLPHPQGRQESVDLALEEFGAILR